MNQKNLLVAAIILTLFIITASYLDDNEKDTKSLVKSYQRGFYSKKNIQTYIEKSARSPVTLLNTTKNSLEDSSDKIKEVVGSYEEIINQDLTQIANDLNILEENHEQAVAWKKINHIKLDPLEEWSPRLILTLSVLVGQDYKDTLKMNKDNLDISMDYWNVLRTFSNTTDLQLLIKQGKLNSNYLTKENLERYYGTKKNKMEKIQDL